METSASSSATFCAPILQNNSWRAFWFQATGHTPFILRVRISAVIADGEALRQSLSCKGAAGLKNPVNICKNVIKEEP